MIYLHPDRVANINVDIEINIVKDDVKWSLSIANLKSIKEINSDKLPFFKDIFR